MSDSSVFYQITPVSLSEHLFEVELHASVPTCTKLTLSLPAWIPGSYMIRDFARNIISIHPHSDEFSLQKQDKQTWLVSRSDGQAFSHIAISYRVFAYDLSVRSAYITDEYAFFNGTSTFLQVHGCEDSAQYLQINKAPNCEHWQIATALAKTSECPSEFDIKGKEVYHCDTYQVLIDSPVLLGDLCQQSFAVDGVTFHVVFTGAQTMDLDRICADLVPICAHHIQLFGESPVSEYWFLTLLCDSGYGGLEHKASTVLQYPRFELPMKSDSAEKTDAYQQFLSLCSHELFHTWHVKRIRPQAMLAPDLSQEVYTPQLWIYEGFTSLYDDLTLARTALISPAEYCKILGLSITRLMRNPGRHLQSIGESSFDAWTRFYKQDASSVNHIVSYYLKGAIMALCLDITIRQQTDNRKSLDDVMRILWQEYGKNESGTLDDVINKICAQHLNIDIGSFLHVGVNTVMDLPLSSLINSIGLSLNMRSRKNLQDKGGDSKENTLTRDFGALTASDAQGLKIKQVLARSAAADAGLQLDDIIVACNHFQVDHVLLIRFLEDTPFGDCIKLHVMRDKRLIELSLVAREAVLDTCFVQISDEERFKTWLGLPQN